MEEVTFQLRLGGYEPFLNGVVGRQGTFAEETAKVQLGNVRLESGGGGGGRDFAGRAGDMAEKRRGVRL